MPWEHCGETILDSDPCPGCGISKEAWTVQFQVERRIQIRRRARLRLRLVDPTGHPVRDEAYTVTVGDGEPERGRTDEHGQAKLTGAAEGRATIEFPDRAAREVVLAPEEGAAPSDARATSEEDDPARFDAAPDQLHRFALQEVKLVRLQLADGEGQALASWRYALELGERRHQGSADEQGLLEVWVALGGAGEDGLLDLWPPEAHEDDPPRRSFLLRPGTLAPAPDVAGLQARLNNLGFDCGPVDGRDGPRTQHALAAFRRKHGARSVEEVYGR